MELGNSIMTFALWRRGICEIVKQDSESLDAKATLNWNSVKSPSSGDYGSRALVIAEADFAKRCKNKDPSDGSVGCVDVEVETREQLAPRDEQHKRHALGNAIHPPHTATGVYHSHYPHVIDLAHA